MHTAFLGIGSNLGDRGENIAKAVKALKDNGIHVLKEAAIRETEPVGGPPQGKYLNTVIKVQTELSAPELLSVIHGIEQTLGRERIIRNGPRTIDIDILLFDSLSLTTENLIIPHPRMAERPFVMEPLAEIAPDIHRKYSRANR